MEENKINQKKQCPDYKCHTPKLKKANKIHLELLSFVKDEIKKKENNYSKYFSISKKENPVKKEDNKDNVNIEQNTNVDINSNNSDTDDSYKDSSDMSGCEEEIII